MQVYSKMYSKLEASIRDGRPCLENKAKTNPNHNEVFSGPPYATSFQVVQREEENNKNISGRQLLKHFDRGVHKMFRIASDLYFNSVCVEGDNTVLTARVPGSISGTFSFLLLLICISHAVYNA